MHNKLMPGQLKALDRNLLAWLMEFLVDRVCRKTNPVQESALGISPENTAGSFNPATAAQAFILPDEVRVDLSSVVHHASEAILIAVANAVTSLSHQANLYGHEAAELIKTACTKLSSVINATGQLARAISRVHRDDPNRSKSYHFQSLVRREMVLFRTQLRELLQAVNSRWAKLLQRQFNSSAAPTKDPKTMHEERTLRISQQMGKALNMLVDLVPRVMSQLLASRPLQRGPAVAAVAGR